MTVITFQKDSKGNYKSMVCEGHAGYAKSGSDIVCAAISILVINTINSLEELCHVICGVDEDEDTGSIYCSFPQNLDEKATVLIDALVLGLKGIQQQYGKKHCKVKFEEV